MVDSKQDTSIPNLQTPILGHGAKYTNYGISLPQPCPPPSNLSATTREKNRSKVPSRKMTMHCPAPRCDSLKVRPMATSERKRVYWQLKTGLRRVHILQNKKTITPISAVDNKKKRFYKIYHPLHPVLDHSADYTYYGNSLPQPCPPPSNLSATAWEKTDQKFLPGKVTMHSPAPRCDSLKVRPMALSERKRGYWQLKTGLQRGTYIAEQKKKKIITPISAVDKKRVYKTSELQMATKICGCDV